MPEHQDGKERKKRVREKAKPQTIYPLIRQDILFDFRIWTLLPTQGCINQESGWTALVAPRNAKSGLNWVSAVERFSQVQSILYVKCQVWVVGRSKDASRLLAPRRKRDNYATSTEDRYSVRNTNNFKLTSPPTSSSTCVSLMNLNHQRTSSKLVRVAWKYCAYLS